jgi:predicted metalloendopeptidase
VNENFRFFGETLTGAKKLKERWKRVIETTDASVGEAARQALCGRQFPAGIKGAHA